MALRHDDTLKAVLELVDGTYVYTTFMRKSMNIEQNYWNICRKYERTSYKGKYTAQM